MDAVECIITRRSMRKFMKKPVSDEVITEIVRAALQSPSYKNSQPWEVAVVSGAKKEELSARLNEALETDTPPTPDIPEPTGWPQEIDDRIESTMQAKCGHLGVDYGDPTLLKKSKAANFRFYGAPHVLYLYQDDELNAWSIFDMGIFAQSLMLAAHAKGVGTVPQAFVIDYSGIVKEVLGIPKSKRLVLGISMGYPETEHVANTFCTPRVSTDRAMNWHR